MEWDNFYSASFEGAGQRLHQDLHVAGGDGEDTGQYIDLNEQLVYNKPSTVFFRMNGDAMTGAGIQNGDVLVVDKSLKATNGKIIIAVVNGDLVVRRFQQGIKGYSLVAENPRYEAIEVGEFTQFTPWGLVTCAIHIFEKNLLDPQRTPAKKKRNS
jgi:DNA polymerase V